MITAVDTNVLLDVLIDRPGFAEASAAALRSCHGTGRVVACDVVWAELTAGYGKPDAAERAMDDLGVTFSSLGVAAALHAGTAWGRYRRAGGSRARLIPDFLIGAHAASQAERLLTRDRGFFRAYFEELEIVDPTA